MGRDITNPLQGLVKRAAGSLPAKTGRVAAQQERINRRAGETIVLADISASMAAPAWGGKRCIDILREAVAGARTQRAVRLFAFSNSTREVDSIPEPELSTDLANALEHVRALDPGVTLVISDGQPNNAARALEVAAQFRGVIDVLYIGLESDTAAMEFMRRLARAAGGDVRAHDVLRLGNAPALLSHIAALLPART
jgi:Mg-chelatase subunit ChlD